MIKIQKPKNNELTKKTGFTNVSNNENYGAVRYTVLPDYYILLCFNDLLQIFEKNTKPENIPRLYTFLAFFLEQYNLYIL